MGVRGSPYQAMDWHAVLRVWIGWNALPEMLRPSRMGQAPRRIEGVPIGDQRGWEEGELSSLQTVVHDDRIPMLLSISRFSCV